MFITNAFIKKFSGYMSENFLYIMIYKYDFFEFISYIVYKREPSKIRGNRRENIRREYDQVSQIIEKKFYL